MFQLYEDESMLAAMENHTAKEIKVRAIRAATKLVLQELLCLNAENACFTRRKHIQRNLQHPSSLYITPSVVAHQSPTKDSGCGLDDKGSVSDVVKNIPNDEQTTEPNLITITPV